VLFIDYNYLTLYFPMDVSSSRIVYLSTDRPDDESRAYARRTCVRARKPRAQRRKREAGERDVDQAVRNSGERNRTIMMRFIESIVCSGSGVHRHNRRVSIAGAALCRERERDREGCAIQSTFNFSMVLHPCESHGACQPVGLPTCAPLFPEIH